VNGRNSVADVKLESSNATISRAVKPTTENDYSRGGVAGSQAISLYPARRLLHSLDVRPALAKTSKRQNVKTSKRQNVKTSKRQNVKTSKRQNVKTSKRQNVKTSKT